MSLIPPVAASVLGNVTLFMLIGGMAATTDLSGFRAQLKNYKGIATGVGCQFFLLPLLGFASLVIFNLSETFGIMLILVTTSPGGGFSGWWCSLGNADISLSIAMTTVSTIVSIGMLPVNLVLYVQLVFGTVATIDWLGFGIPIMVVIAAVLCGLALGTYLPQYKNIFNKAGTVGGLLNIILGLIASSSGGGTALWGYEPAFYFAVGSPCLLGLLISFGIARALRVPLPEAVAICIECCYQNTGLAITVALTVFDDPRDAASAAAVPIIYAGFEIALIALFTLVAWRLNFTYAPPSEPFFKCLTGNYQPLTEADKARLEAEQGADGETETPPHPKAMASRDAAALSSQTDSARHPMEEDVEAEAQPPSEPSEAAVTVETRTV